MRRNMQKYFDHGKLFSNTIIPIFIFTTASPIMFCSTIKLHRKISCFKNIEMHLYVICSTIRSDLNVFVAVSDFKNWSLLLLTILRSSLTFISAWLTLHSTKSVHVGMLFINHITYAWSCAQSSSAFMCMLLFIAQYIWFQTKTVFKPRKNIWFECTTIYQYMCLTH